MRSQKEYTNPIKGGLQFVRYLRDHPESTYDDIAVMFGVSQMIALIKMLPDEIIGYFYMENNFEELKYFTERRIRPLTLIASDEEKIERFRDMKQTISGE